MIITQKNTKIFANLSGDKNKIHLDKKYSRKFFRQPIVHGINLNDCATAKFM